MPGRERCNLLIFGGTGEAALLAAAALARFGERLAVTTSLAGRTTAPAPIPGAVRRGGFGGAAGLADWLRAARIDFMVDATHPFAARIAHHARLAAEASGTPRLVLRRPPWRREAGDRWIAVRDMDEAARALPRHGRRALLTIGARDLAAFASLAGVALVVRLIEAPRAPLPLPAAALVVGRPPFVLDEERLLLHRYAIDVVVAKASGGPAAKLVAAREAGLPVIMVERPPPEPGPAVETMAEAIEWIAAQLVRGWNGEEAG